MIKVLIVDDSAIIRKMITKELSRFEDIEIVGTAIDPYVARDKIVRLQPDVITLDLEMPRMNGLSFLEKLMKHYPIPVVVLSSLTPKDSETALKAFDLGAVEVLHKPETAEAARNISKNLVRAIRTAAVAKMNKSPEGLNDTVQPSRLSRLSDRQRHKVIAIGASTGGTKAIEILLRGMHAAMPGIMIVQHMPEKFTAAFAERLDRICPMEVQEAQDLDWVVPGRALIAPGGYHMVLKRTHEGYQVKIKTGPPVNYQRPSVDVLFQSAAKQAGSDAIGILLTGMGADGAKGLLSMKENGAKTIAQDERSCVVFGMPKEAIKLGAAGEVCSLANIPRMVISLLSDHRK
jgi:two-component system chemotaxis response regulator CheB